MNGRWRWVRILLLFGVVVILGNPVMKVRIIVYKYPLSLTHSSVALGFGNRPV